MEVEVHSSALVAAAGQLDAAAGALAAAAATVPAAEPLALDETSVSAAARLSAHGAVLASRAADGAAVLAAAAAALRQAVGAYQRMDAANAALVAARGGGDARAPVFTPAPTFDAATPALPISPAAPRDAKTLAALIEAGSAGGASTFGATCRSYGERFRSGAQAARDAAAAVRAGLSGLTGPNLADSLMRFEKWADAMGAHAEILNAASVAHGDRFGRTQQAMPETAEFTDLEHRLAAAQARNSRPATAGMYAPVIASLQSQLLGLHSRTHVAATNYLVGELPAAPPGPPPVTPIVNPAPGNTPGAQPVPGGASGDRVESSAGGGHGGIKGDSGGAAGDDGDDDGDDANGGSQGAPLNAAGQPMSALTSMLPSLLGGVVGAAAAIPTAVVQGGQAAFSQASQAVEGLASGLAKPDTANDLGVGGLGEHGGPAGSSGGGATSPAAGASLSPSSAMMSAGAEATPATGGAMTGSAAPASPPTAGAGGGGLPMMMPPMGGMGMGAAGGTRPTIKPPDKEVVIAPVANGEPVRGEVVRRSARASIDGPAADEVVVTRGRKRVVLDEADGGRSND